MAQLSRSTEATDGKRGAGYAFFIYYLLSRREHRQFRSDDDMSEDRPETLTAKFLNFFTRASACSSIFTSGPSVKSSPHPVSGSRSNQRHIILLEDIPNVLHPRVQEAVHNAFRAFVEAAADGASPCVIIVSDAGLRGESDDGVSVVSRTKDVLDIRAILPPNLLNGPFVQEVRYVYS
jgi:cell cycle checkpoint protein